MARPTLPASIVSAFGSGSAMMATSLPPLAKELPKKLAVKLKKDLGVQVVLTRTDDRFVSLEDRTAMANAEDADLFISLHMNASSNSEARGLETYYLDNTTDEASVRLAARENSTSRRNVSDLQFILSDMTQNMKLEDSVTLAHRLHDRRRAAVGVPVVRSADDHQRAAVVREPHDALFGEPIFSQEPAEKLERGQTRQLAGVLLLVLVGLHHEVLDCAAQGAGVVTAAT